MTQPRNTQPRQLVVTSVTALLQKTFPPGEIQKRTRTLARGDKINPLDLIEWLEAQGCEPEAQVTQKGEIALRGGILDVWPLTSPWPVRLEFFGDELESLRHFDPLTQISREEIFRVTLPPAGELGLLKSKVQKSKVQRFTNWQPCSIICRAETIFLLCEPEQLATCADEYAQQIPEDDPFFIGWADFLIGLNRRSFTSVELADKEIDGGRARHGQTRQRDSSCRRPALRIFSSLDAFRPLGERAPDPQIAEAQRREFFNQLHRWLRQGHAVHVFCNNDGERQRFGEIWNETNLSPQSAIHGPQSDSE